MVGRIVPLFRLVNRVLVESGLAEEVGHCVGGGGEGLGVFFWGGEGEGLG